MPLSAETRTIRSEHQHLQDGDAYRWKVAALLAATREQAQAYREAAMASAEEVAAGEEVRRAMDELREEKETKRDDGDRTPDSRRTPETLESDRSLDTRGAPLIFEAEVTPPARSAAAELRLRAARGELRTVQRSMGAGAGACGDGVASDATCADADAFTCAATEAGTANSLVQDGESEREPRSRRPHRERATHFQHREEQPLVANSSFRSLAEETRDTGCTGCSSSNTGCKSWRGILETKWNAADQMWDGVDQMWDGKPEWSIEQVSPFATMVNSFQTLTKKAQEVMQEVSQGTLGMLREVRRHVDVYETTENILDVIVGELGREPGPGAEQKGSVDLSATSFVPENPSACTLIQSMFNDEKTADVVFEVKGEGGDETATFYAHRFILQKCSRTMAGLCGAEDGTATVIITDVRPSIFRLLLGHVYGQKLADADLKARCRELIGAADRYGVGHLKLEAEACLVESTPITLDNMMEHLLYADARNCALLKEAVMDFFAEHKVEILRRADLKDLPGGPLTDMLAVMAREEGAGGDAERFDQFCMMRVNDLRRKVHEKGLDVYGSRDTLVAALEESS